MNELEILSPLEKIDYLNPKNIAVYIKRDDQINSPLIGNKYRKLLPHIQKAKATGKHLIISCGGAFSNHVHSLSFVPELFDIEVMVFIRGNLSDSQNPNTQFLLSKNITLEPIGRKEYQQINQVMRDMANSIPSSYVIPEGGTDPLAVTSMQKCYFEIENQLANEPDFIVCPVGSGGTISGIIKASSDKTTVIGIGAVKTENATNLLIEIVKQFVGPQKTNWEILRGERFGHFGHYNEYTHEQALRVKSEWNILPDPIYNVRTMAWTMDRLAEGYFPENSTVVILHSGGLQGWEGMKYRYGERFDFGGLSNLI